MSPANWIFQQNRPFQEKLSHSPRQFPEILLNLCGSLEQRGSSSVNLYRLIIRMALY
jgi:hypothetical protein